MPEYIESSNQSAQIESRNTGLQKVDHFLHLLGIEKEGNLDSPEARIKMIQSITPEKFMEILYIADEQLTGQKNPEVPRDEILTKGVAQHVITRGDYETPAMAPFANFQGCAQELAKFFTQMQEQITPDTIDQSAMQLLVALQTAHIFPDGNGRLSRQAAVFLSTGKLYEDALQSNRTGGKFEFLNQKGEAIYNTATFYTYLKYFPELADNCFKKIFFMDKAEQIDINDVRTYMAQGETNELMTQKWLAAVNAGLATPDQEVVTGENWTDEEKEKFEKTLEAIQKEVFWKSIELAGKKGAVESYQKSLADAIQP